MIEFANQDQLTNHTLQIAKSFQFPLSTYLIRPYTSRFDLKHEKWSLHSFLTTVPQQADVAGNILLFF
jgi:hypothetical protein